MKTIKEHIESLPEPYRTQAINNTKENYKELQVEKFFKIKVETIQTALRKSFVFKETPEGFSYWHEQYNQQS